MTGLIKGKGKIVFILVITILVIASIYFYNMHINDRTALVTSENGSYVIASGTVENNSVLISSETTGTSIGGDLREGDTLKAGQIIAKLNNSTLQNQYKQAEINARISEENVHLIEASIKKYKTQNNYAIDQARYAYLSAQGECNKVMDGVSSEEIAQAQGSADQAKRNMNQMQINLERSKALLGGGAISQSDYETVENNYYLAVTQYNAANEQLNLLKSKPTDAEKKTAENKMLQAKSGYSLSVANGDFQLQQLQSQLEIAKTQLDLTKQVLEQARGELDKTVIKSPIDGVISTLFYRKGELVISGKPIAEIFDPNQIEVRAYISEMNIGHIKVGQDVNLYVDSNRKQAFKGKVIKINEEAEFTPKNIQTKEERVNTVFEVKIKVIDAKGIIKAGMPVDVEINIEEAPL